MQKRRCVVRVLQTSVRQAAGLELAKGSGQLQDWQLAKGSAATFKPGQLQDWSSPGQLQVSCRIGTFILSRTVCICKPSREHSARAVTEKCHPAKRTRTGAHRGAAHPYSKRPHCNAFGLNRGFIQSYHPIKGESGAGL